MIVAPDGPEVFYATIDSTNAEAARRAAAGDMGPLWIRAGAQTAGRGRRGRSWVSQPGNLFLTYLGATDRPPRDVALLSYAAALAVADLIDAAVGRSAAALKWPNDVLVDGRKISGILLESGAVGGDAWFSIGVGVNLVGAPEGAVDQAVCALADVADRVPTPEAAAATLRQRLSHWAARLGQQGFEPLRAAWLARAQGLGRSITAHLGREVAVGEFAGLSADGALELALPGGGTRLINAGEIHFAPNSD